MPTPPANLVPPVTTWDYFPELAVIVLAFLVLGSMVYGFVWMVARVIKGIQNNVDTNQAARDKIFTDTLQVRDADFTKRMEQRDQLWLTQIKGMTDSFREFMTEERESRNALLTQQGQALEDSLAQIFTEVRRAQDGISANNNSLTGYHGTVMSALDEMRRAIHKQKTASAEARTTPVKGKPIPPA